MSPKSETTAPVNGAAVAIDLSELMPMDTAMLEILKIGGIDSTGWKIEFAGPSHPKTIAWNNEQTRKAMRKNAQIEMAQANGRKFKSEERDPEEQRLENVSWVVSRIVSWTPIKLTADGPPMEFSPETAMTLLSNPKMGWAFTQMIDFIIDERSFMQRSAKV